MPTDVAVDQWRRFCQPAARRGTLGNPGLGRDRPRRLTGRDHRRGDRIEHAGRHRARWRQVAIREPAFAESPCTTASGRLQSSWRKLPTPEDVVSPLPLPYGITFGPDKSVCGYQCLRPRPGPAPGPGAQVRFQGRLPARVTQQQPRPPPPTSPPATRAANCDSNRKKSQRKLPRSRPESPSPTDEESPSPSPTEEATDTPAPSSMP